MAGHRHMPGRPTLFLPLPAPPLPTGSCCVLKGYGGDTAMHCVPPVAARRISVTLRRRVFFMGIMLSFLAT